MNYHPILFSASMVRAILAGLKTQTRRTRQFRWSVGDRLWVRENFFVSHMDFFREGLLPTARPEWAGEMLHYSADGTCCDQIPECACAEVGKPKTRVSIHMPRWASRITLEVRALREEALQDISEDDAKSEGIRREYLSPDPDSFHPPGSYGYVAGTSPDEIIQHTRVDAFRALWDSINGTWNDNPRVFVTTFRRIEQ